ncbi:MULTISPECIES: lysophospholipid acyltransferase family protein [unclassified Zunongwangia]|uniref:lysophospholipid acyltransferase family protein n=1 Tax=unclassified Zunongwangia TaxID=2632541 RepID=UPI0022DD9C06|nr:MULTISPECIES: lysophospholipid acyltransferase family protein [unclassified Zunongwangia]WBL24010.1 lysophospholipid acyltransferase family protein [Zunongwangia sp. HRR-M8]WBL25624.1 lysophospholipid acyltransferase family protein [Zunongwangia sp. HGR-M22]
MRFLKNIAIAVWRIWFYVLLVVPIIIMLPILVVFTSSERFYPQFFFCARMWAKFIIFGMGFYRKVVGGQKLEKGYSYMFVANHCSIIDIMLMLSTINHPFVFVGKKELVKIPIFGFFYKRTCILVDRKNPQSRQAVFNEAQRRLKQGNSICIFPEGGVPDDESIVLDEFKEGAFKLAIDHQIPIVPLTFHDTKKRFSYTFFSGSPGKLRVKIHDFISTKGKTQQDRKALKLQNREVILQELNNPTVN